MPTYVYYRSALTGGAANALDEVDGSTLVDGDAAFVLDGSTFYVYQLDASSGASESSPDVIAPDTNPSTKRWILQAVQNAVNETYTEITTATNLATGKNYIAKNTAATHTLPELSGLTDGETLQLHVSGGDATVVVNEHANDSNAELATFYARGDGARFTVVDGAWEVSDEVVTVEGLLALTADDAIAANTEEKVFDASYSEKSDVGGWWDSTTNHRLDIPTNFDCTLVIGGVAMCDGGKGIRYSIYIDGSPVIDFNSGSPAGTFNSFQFEVSGGSNVEIYGANGTGSSNNLWGDANEDESRITWKVLRRNR